MKKRMMASVISVVILLFVSTSFAQIVLTFNSDPWHSVGRGDSFTTDGINECHISMRNYRDNGLHVKAWWYDEDNIYHDYGFDATAPDNGFLELGRYNDASRYPFNDAGTPGLSFWGEGRCSNASWGYFDILEIEYNEWGTPDKVAINFAHFNTLTYTGPDPNLNAGLYGQFRWCSDIPLDPVPIPGAIWLLGSGLFGLIFVRKKRKLIY